VSVGAAGAAGASETATPPPGSAPEPAVRMRGLTKRFGPVLALDGLDLDVPRGSIFGLLGPNGAGKTTTIRILTGLARATAGSASIAGVSVADDRPALRSRIGYLDQDPRFYGWMKGRELLELVGRLAGLHGEELRSRVQTSLQRTGLADAGKRRIGTYSGGMRQRLGIAQAVLHEPELLILDEPVSSLDPEGRRDLLELIEGMRGEATVVVSTHVLADVERICDRVAILDRGRLVTEGPLAELLERHARPIFELVPALDQADAVAALAERLRAAPWVSHADAAAGTLRVTVSDAAAAARGILPLVVECGVVLTSFEQARPTLEDVFLELVGPASSDELDGRGFLRAREACDR
jgi:ABC-2 type transport system ATP-binding protein